MNNKFFFIPGVLGLGLVGFWLWCQRPGLPVERILPDNPLVFMQLVHPRDHIDQMIHSDLGKSLAVIDLPDVLSRNNLLTGEIRDIQLWQSGLAKFWDNPLVHKFLVKEAALAVYRQEGNYYAIAVLRLTLSTRIVELLGQLFHQWGEETSVTQQEYFGRGINHILFKKQGVGLAYVRIRDLLIITPDPSKHLEEVVDVYQHRRQALQFDPSYSVIRHNAYPSGDGLVFLNLNGLADIWRGQPDARLSSWGQRSAAFPLIGLSFRPGKISKYKMVLGLNEKYFSSHLQRVYSCPALANETLKLVPVNAILYQWAGCYDLQEVWGLAKARIDDRPGLAKDLYTLKAGFEKSFQVSIRHDILPVLGQEIGGYLTDIDMQGTYPYPRILIFVKVQDRAKADAVLAKLAQNPIAAVEKETYNQVDIHYLALHAGANMDPGYGFLGDYLLVASSRQLLKLSIDAYGDSLHSIEADDTVAQLGLDNGNKFHSMAVMKTAELSRRAQDFLGWLDRYLSGQVSMAAAYRQDGDSKKQEIDEAIADKNAELVLAQRKLSQLKSTSLTEITLEESEWVSGAIENLNRQETSIREDIANYKAQKDDLAHLLDNYAVGAQSAKLTMYDMENVVSPVLKGLESIDTQAVTVRFGDRILETEFLVK